MKTKVVITGASGLLGRPILNEFVNNGKYDAIGLAYSRVGENLVKLDLTDEAAVREFFAAQRPQFIVHSAAHRRPDVCENDADATEALNVSATRLLAEISRDLGAFMVYVSTDYVFDGTNPPYKPSDAPNPLNTYGRSKLEGEKVMREIIPQSSAVLRVPILYGPCKELAESAVLIMLPAIRDTSKPAVMDSWAVRYPTYTPDVAAVIRMMADYRASHPQFAGIFHFHGGVPMTRYDMAVGIAQIMGIASAHIKANPTPTPGAPRPQNAALDCGELEKLGLIKRTDFSDGIKASLKSAM